MRKFYLVLFCIILSIISYAQENPIKENYKVDDLFLLNLEDLVNINITVASKTKESWIEAPSSVTVISRSEILSMGLESVQEVLNFIPGFLTMMDVEQGKSHRIAARGRSTALSESILFLMNGQRLNDLYSGGISILNRIIAIENVKQIEIIRGPGSALYGSNAFLGVVNIVTITDVTNVNLAMGNITSRNLSTNFSQSLTNDIDITIFAKAFSDEGYNFKKIKDQFGRELNVTDPQKGYDISGTLKYKNFSLNGRHMERSLNGFATFGTISQLSNEENSRQSLFDLRYEIVQGRWDGNFRVGYSFDRWNTLAVAFPKGYGPTPEIILNEDLIVGPVLESYNGNISGDFSYSFSSRNKLHLGFSYENTGISHLENRSSHNIYDDFEPFEEITNIGKNYPFNLLKSRNILGVYLQEKLKISRNIDLTVGTRYDYYDDFGSTINPRGAIVYSTKWNSNFKFIYGEAFRAPNFLELYDKNNPIDFGNHFLKPEKIRTLELVYIQKLKHLTNSITAFHNNIHNLIELGDPVVHKDNPFFVSQFTNVEDGSNFKGIELQSVLSPSTKMRLNLNFTHYFDSSPYMPSNFGSFIFNYSEKKWNANFKGIYRGKAGALPNQEPYGLLSSNFRYHVKNQKLNLNFAVDNIFNTQYLTPSILIKEGVANRGRTIRFGIEINL
jgi:outer membrane receptor for ferrienterochelin and colicins